MAWNICFRNFCWDYKKMSFTINFINGFRFMVKPQTSYIRMTYEYIRVTYGWHTSTYKWYTDDIQVTHAVWKKNKGNLFKAFWYSASKYLICKRIHFYAMAILGYLSKLKGSGISFCCTFSVWFFHTNVPYLILYQLRKFQRHIFFPSQDIK